MSLTRRTMLKGAGALPLLAGNLGFSALAQTASTPPVAADMAPVLFVHGHGDHAALWITTLWRMESNGVPRERMLAINFTDPLARNDDKVEQANRSSTEDQRRELADAVKELKGRTGAPRIALATRSATTSRMVAAPISATRYCAAFLTMASLLGTMVSPASSMAAARSCAA